MSLLEIKNLHVQIEDKKILNGLTLTVEPGQVAAIMGPNGSGKSTLAYVLAGRPGYEVTEGSVTLTLPFPGEGRGPAAPGKSWVPAFAGKHAAPPRH
jgi:Fe-S cluster assembly ATP-binding protein